MNLHLLDLASSFSVCKGLCLEDERKLPKHTPVMLSKDQ